MGGRISPSLVISIIALFVALGGASYAAIKIPKNSVGTKQIKNRAVTSNKVKDGTLLLKDFRAGQVKPNIYFGEREASPPFSIPGSPSLGTVVETTTELPAGNYLLFGRANVVAGAVESSVTCVLGSGGSADTAQLITVPADKSIALSMTGPYTLISSGSASLLCFRDGGTADVYQASIIAQPVNRIIGLP